ncbi:MAG: hypothetical protein AB8B69_04625 [Chitinophagales bacterium]
MNKIHVLSLLVMFVFISCEDKPAIEGIEGLWIVKSVIVGEEEKTPNARWTRFNPDLTQESGNGWLQHSFGTWKLNPKTNELFMVNSNGLDDDEPFVATINQNQMTWNRIEEGQNVTVSLVRASRLPSTFGDELIGLWKLEEAIGNGKYFEENNNTESGEYIFFRWDKKFSIGSKKGRVSGVYNVHGHKPEVELIPYGEEVKRDFWKIQFDENDITLKLLNTDSIITRKFQRIHEFPEE